MTNDKSQKDDPAPSSVGEEKLLLQVEHLSKIFATDRGWSQKPAVIRAVDDVSLFIRVGETLGLVGETGCGKTTLGRLCLRLLQPTYGQIAFDNENLTDLDESALRPIRRRMQPIFQSADASLNPQLSVSQVVREGLRIHHISPTTQNENQRVADILKRVGLDSSVLKRRVQRLSSGERQRVALARALALSPDLLVCDEPVSALDPSVRAQIVNLMLELQQELKLAYLLISHDLRMVCYMSHRVAVMYLGRIVETADTERLTQSRAHPYTKALFDSAPTVDPSQRRLPVLLEGALPDPHSPPEGCGFHPRCPRFQPGVCDETVPQLRELEVGSGHWIACFNPLQ